VDDSNQASGVCDMKHETRNSCNGSKMSGPIATNPVDGDTVIGREGTLIRAAMNISTNQNSRRAQLQYK
jgi:predicted RNA-binding protein YlqC (UPF0109 family)